MPEPEEVDPIVEKLYEKMEEVLAYEAIGQHVHLLLHHSPSDPPELWRFVLAAPDHVSPVADVGQAMTQLFDALFTPDTKNPQAHDD
jgi:hypothetical protein